MAPPTRTPRTSWIDEGLRVLAEYGPEAVRVEALARSLGVSKGGFYGHFHDRQALLDAMLDTWEQRTTDDVLARVDDDGGDARTKVRRAGELTFSASDGLRAVDLAVRDWSRRDPTVAERLRRVDNKRMDYLRTQFRSICHEADDVEVLAMLAFSLLIGNHFIAADHHPYTRAEVLDLTLDRMLDRLAKET